MGVRPIRGAAPSESVVNPRVLECDDRNGIVTRLRRLADTVVAALRLVGHLPRASPLAPDQRMTRTHGANHVSPALRAIVP